MCAEFEGYQPAEGNQLLVAEVTIKNTFDEEIEMYDTDFQAQWGGSGDDDFSVPITWDGTEEGMTPLTDDQLPGIYSLAKGESRTGLLVFEVPEGKTELSISYMEAFDDDSTGETFFVNFYSRAEIKVQQYRGMPECGMVFLGILFLSRRGRGAASSSDRQYGFCNEKSP